MKASIIFTDIIGKRGRVSIAVEFDPPIARGCEPSPAQQTAIEAVRALQGTASRARVTGSNANGEEEIVDLDDIDDSEDDDE